MKTSIALCLYTSGLFCVIDPQIIYIKRVSILRAVTFGIKTGLILWFIMTWIPWILIGIVVLQGLQCFLDRDNLVPTKLLLLASSVSLISFIFVCPLGLSTHRHAKTLRLFMVVFNILVSVGIVLNALTLYELNYNHWCQLRAIWSAPDIQLCPPPDTQPAGDFSLNEIYPICSETATIDCTRKSDFTLQSLILHDYQGSLFLTTLIVYAIVTYYCVKHVKLVA